MFLITKPAFLNSKQHFVVGIKSVTFSYNFNTGTRSFSKRIDRMAVTESSRKDKQTVPQNSVNY